MFDLDDWLDAFTLGLGLLILCLFLMFYAGCGPVEGRARPQLDRVQITAEPELQGPLEDVIEAVNAAAGRVVVSKGLALDNDKGTGGVWLRSVSVLPIPQTAGGCGTYVTDLLFRYEIYVLDDEHAGPCAPYLRLILIHEIGHALGLEHSEDVSSIMFERTAAYLWTLDMAAESLIAALDARPAGGP